MEQIVEFGLSRQIKNSVTSAAPRTSPCSGIPLILQIDRAPHTTITVVAIILAYVMNSPERANAIEVIYTMP